MIGEYPAYQIKFDDRDFWQYNVCTFDERGLEPIPININFSIAGRKEVEMPFLRRNKKRKIYGLS